MGPRAVGGLFDAGHVDVRQTDGDELTTVRAQPRRWRGIGSEGGMECAAALRARGAAFAPALVAHQWLHGTTQGAATASCRHVSSNERCRTVEDKCRGHRVVTLTLSVKKRYTGSGEGTTDNVLRQPATAC